MMPMTSGLYAGPVVRVGMPACVAQVSVPLVILTRMQSADKTEWRAVLRGDVLELSNQRSGQTA